MPILTSRDNHVYPDVSIVVPTFNATKTIEKCLNALLDQKTDVRYEIIVVDSSVDHTAEILEAYQPDIHVIRRNQRTYPGLARNIGVQAARGQIIYFTDADCIADQNWIECLYRAFNDSVEVVAGSIGNGSAGDYVATSEYLLEFNDYIPKQPNRTKTVVPTANIAIKKKVLNRLPPLSGSIKGSDTQLCQDLKAAGHTIYFERNACVFHLSRSRLLDYCRNQYHLGQGSRWLREQGEISGQVLIKYPVMMPLLPLARSVLITGRLWRYDLAALLSFIGHYPAIFLGLVAYTAGFMKGQKDLQKI